MVNPLGSFTQNEIASVVLFVIFIMAFAWVETEPSGSTRIVTVLLTGVFSLLAGFGTIYVLKRLL